MRWWTRLAACVVSLASGCATQALWEGASRPEPIGGTGVSPSSAASPIQLLAARRTADGAHHLEVLASDGRPAHYVVDGTASAPSWTPSSGSSSAWPPVFAAPPPSRPRLEWAAMPSSGLPIDVGREPVVPPDGAAEPVPSMRLEGRRVVLTDVGGERTVIAEFPPPTRPPSRPPPRSVGPAQSAREVVHVTVRLALTPLALAADAVLGAGIVVGGVFVLPFLPFVGL